MSFANVNSGAFQCQGYEPGRIVYPGDLPTLAPEWRCQEHKNIKEPSMLGTVSKDLKSFILEHKLTIYWIAVLLLVDHFFFNGAYRQKINGIMHKLIGKVEDTVDRGLHGAATTAATTTKPS